MPNIITKAFHRLTGKPARVNPTETIGAHGAVVYGGYLQDNEANPSLATKELRYKTYSEILANTSIVAAGTRYFLNLIAKAEWTFSPSEADTDGKFAELAEEMLTVDPKTPWHRIVRRAAMYRFYGFSVQEWTAMRREDGLLTLKDVAPRAQKTIERWDMDEEGLVVNIIQASPATHEELVIPRAKTLYMVDDTLSDSPEGLGLFRHLVEPAQRLSRYEQLEGWGFETDLRGIPIGRGPFTHIAKLVKDGKLSKAQQVALEMPVRSFVKDHVKNPKLGLVLDSKMYETKDESGRPSSARQWDIELLKGSSTSFRENAEAINRLNHDIARVLGVEQLMLGSSSTGSFALSKDKTSTFFLLVDSALMEIREQVADDLLATIWKLNGWDEEMMPTIATEAVKATDVEQLANVLRDVATAGAPILPDDPVVAEIRELMGVSAPDPEAVASAMAEDAALNQDTNDLDPVEDPKEDLGAK